ncbi:hypothetical protein DRQ26_04555, partial [bacterium]
MLKKVIPAVFLLMSANISFAQDTRVVAYGEKAEYFYSRAEYNKVIAICRKILRINKGNMFASALMKKARDNQKKLEDLKTALKRG